MCLAAHVLAGVQAQDLRFSKAENGVITAKDLLEAANFKEVKISPSGETALVEIERPSVVNNRNVDNWVLVSLRDGARIELDRELSDALAAGFIGWMPDSTWLAYLKGCPLHCAAWKLNLHTFRSERFPLAVHVDAGREMVRKITDGGTLQPGLDAVLSPDGHTLAYETSASPGTDPAPTEDSVPMTGLEADINWIKHAGQPERLPNSEYDKRHLLPFRPESSPKDAELWTIDLKTGEQRLVSNVAGRPSTRYGHFAWSNKGRVLAYIADSGLHLLDLDTSIDKVVFRGLIEPPQFSPDDRLIAFVSAGEVVLLRVSDGVLQWEAAAAAPEYMGLHDEVTWIDHGNRLCAEVGGTMRNVLYSLDIVTRTFHEMPSSLSFAQCIGYSSKYNVMVAEEEDLSHPPQLFKVSNFDERAWSFGDLYNPEPILKDRLWPITTEVSWPSKDGKFTVHGLLMRPANTPTTSRLPLIVWNQGGPSAVRNTFFQDRAYPGVVLASQGYLVLLPNSRGRDGFGAAFHEAINVEQSYVDHPLGDVLAGVEMLVAQGQADGTRLGIMGFSYGGSLTAWAICKTDVFKAASIGEGETDKVRLYRDQLGRLSDAEWWVPYVHAGLTKDEADNPMDHVDAVHTPNLNEFGIWSLAADLGRPWFQAMQFFHIPSELVVYPRSGHGWLGEPRLLLDSYNRNIGWFDYWLRDKPYPDKARQEEYDSWKEQRSTLKDPRWSGVAAGDREVNSHSTQGDENNGTAQR